MLLATPPLASVATLRVPVLTVVAPRYVLLPDNVSVPPPVLVRALAVAVPPSAITPFTTASPVPATVSVRLVAELDRLIAPKVVRPLLLIVSVGLPASVLVRVFVNVMPFVPPTVLEAKSETALPSVRAASAATTVPPPSTSVPVPNAALLPAPSVPVVTVVAPV